MNNKSELVTNKQKKEIVKKYQHKLYYRKSGKT